MKTKGPRNSLGPAGWFQTNYAGFSLFVVSVLWIFAGLKGYYDAKERQQHQH